MGRLRKYFTEEERKAAQREYTKQYREKHPEYWKQYEQDHKEERAQYRKEHKEEKAEYQKKYRQEHKDELAEKNKQYYEKYKNDEEYKSKRSEYNKMYAEKYPDYNKEKSARYLSTPIGRAHRILYRYKENDKQYNRGECTLTSEWIVENVFSGQCCHYCFESDWTKLGVDRIDNSLPHTPENCVVCCRKCNLKKARYDYDTFMRMIGKVK